jgi:hypothetical protein
LRRSVQTASGRSPPTHKLQDQSFRLSQEPENTAWGEPIYNGFLWAIPAATDVGGRRREMGVARDKIVGWGVGQQRPHCGLRVRMGEGFQQRGTGTIIKVIDSGLAQPLVRVKWDGGKASTYFSGASVSRNAVSRPLHPEPAQVRTCPPPSLPAMMASVSLGGQRPSLPPCCCCVPPSWLRPS